MQIVEGVATGIVVKHGEDLRFHTEIVMHSDEEGMASHIPVNVIFGIMSLQCLS
jgi:hypothetical protein